MAYDNVLRPPDSTDSDTPHALQRVEHQHTDVLKAKLQRAEHEHADALQAKLQRLEHEHADILQAKLQQRDHEHEDILREKLQRHEHEHQHALLDRREPQIDPFPGQLALIAIIAAIVLNGAALLLQLGHTAPIKMVPFAVGLVAGVLPTMLAWTVAHQSRRIRGRAARYLARLLWLASIVLFAIGSVYAAS